MIKKNKFKSPYIIETWRNLEKFAEKGLRTLIICQREITYKEYENWQKRYHVNKKVIKNNKNISLGGMHFNYRS